MNEFGVSDEHLQKVREQQRREIEEAKAHLAPWLAETPDDFPKTHTKIVAMMEIAFDHTIDLHGPGAFEMLYRHFLRVTQRRSARACPADLSDEAALAWMEGRDREPRGFE